MTIEALLTEACPDALFVARDASVRWANAAADRLLGHPPGALPGQPFAGLLAAGEFERVQTLLAQREEGFGDLAETYRLRFVRADGSPVVTDARFTKRDGELVITARDATDQVRAEQLMGRLSQLPHSLEGADALIDAAEPIFLDLGWRGAFVQLVPEGSVTLRPVACPPGDPVGDYARSIVGQTLPPERTAVLSQVLKEGRALFLDNVPSFLSGPVAAAQKLSQSLTRAHAYRSAWCPVRSGGELTHLLAMAGRGMTEHDFVALQLFATAIGAANDLHQLRTELVRRQRLAVVGELAAVLAHEVRNPLGVVFNAVAGLKRLVTGEPGASLLVSLTEEAERLRRLMTDLVDFARPAAPALIPLSLHRLAQEAAVAARQELALPRSTPVKVEIGPDVPDVLADAELLRRALEALLVNALQHVPARGGVEVLAARVQDEVRVRVYYQGTPLTGEQAAGLFEPFSATHGPGPGLGLAVVRRIMEDMGGRAELEQAPSGVAIALTVRAA